MPNFLAAQMPPAVRTVLLCWTFVMFCGLATLLINNTIGLGDGDYTGADGDWIQLFGGIWVLLSLVGSASARRMANRKASARGTAAAVGVVLATLLLFGLIAMLSIGTAGIGAGLFTLTVLPAVVSIVLVVVAIAVSFRPEVARHLAES